MTSHKRTAPAWIVGTLISVPVLYVLSFGPACWWFSEEISIGIRVAPRIYWPIGYLISIAHESSGTESFAYRSASWYATLGNARTVILSRTYEEGNAVPLCRDDAALTELEKLLDE